MRNINDMFANRVKHTLLNVLRAELDADYIHSVSFLFEDDTPMPITFSCNNDGESIKVERTLPKDFSMDEYGEVINKKIEGDYLGKINRCKVYFCKGKPISFEVSFSNGELLSITNWGDDLIVKTTSFITEEREHQDPFPITSQILKPNTQLNL